MVGLVPVPSIPIPVIRPTPFADYDCCEFRPRSPSLESAGPLLAPNTFVEPITAQDNATGSLDKSVHYAVDAGAPVGLVFRPPVVFPTFIIVAITPAPTDLVSSRTQRRVGAADFMSHATHGYGFRRRATVALPQRSAPTPDNGQPSPSEKKYLDRVSRAKSAAHVAGVHGPKNAFDTVFVLR